MKKVPQRVNISPVHRLLALLETSLARLNKQMPPDKLEQTAILIQEAMSTRNRFYHRVSHVIDVTKGAGAIETLALLFHDIVYWQVDRTRHSMVRFMITPFFPDEEGKLTLTNELQKQREEIHHSLCIVSKVFGFRTGQVLTPQSGLNEFLSALVADKCLSDILSPWEIMQVVTCIEATIPFRAGNLSFGQAQEATKTRLLDLSEKIGTKIGTKVTPAQIKKAMNARIDVSNRDLANFATRNTTTFLDNTWQLLFEGNPPLQIETYKISDYRKALQKVEVFLSTLLPENIFVSAPGHISEKNLPKLQAQAKKNLSASVQYLRAKLISIAVTEAIAVLTGGDTLLMLFSLGHGIRNSKATSNKSKVLSLLQEGTAEQTGFDLRKSPVAAYFYARMKLEELDKTLQAAQHFFSGSLSAMDFLKSTHLRKHIVTLLPTFAKVVWTREDKFKKLEQELKLAS